MLCNKTLLSFISVLLLAAGCQQQTGTPRMEIQGTVTHQGKPVPRGRIDFRPDLSQGNDGPAGYARVVEGVFDTRVEGRGVVTGPHVVVINGFDGEPTDVEGLRDGLPVFDPYQTTVEIVSGESNYDFEVP